MLVNILGLATGMMVARNAGIPDAAEQVRLGLLGAVTGGVVGVVLTSQLARNEVAAQSGQGSIQLAAPPLPGPAGGPDPAGGPTVPGSPATPTLVEVPRVVHLSLEEARKQLLQPDLGLQVAVQYARPAREEPRDVVLEQHNPDGSHGSFVPLGTTITLIVSSGPPEVQPPSIVDQLASVQASQQRELEALRTQHQQEMHALKDEHRAEMNVLKDINEAVQRLLRDSAGAPPPKPDTPRKP